MGLWGVEVPYGTLDDGAGNTAPLGITSTSTLLLTAGVVMPRYWLRVYGMLDENLGAAADAARSRDSATFTDANVFRDEAAESFDSEANCPDTFVAGESMRGWISFADSDPAWFPRFGVTDADCPLNFEPTVAAADELLEALAQGTCVPGFKAPTLDWPYARRMYDLSACTYATVEIRAAFWAQYKDVSVVKIPALVDDRRVPGGNGGEEQEPTGYLMITVRQRVLASEASEVDKPEVDASNPFNAFQVGRFTNSRGEHWGLGGPGTCYSDIVCWYADDAAFRTNVKGPFGLVHSAFALDTQPHARLWLGVPGAAWHQVGGEWWLYVYYQCEPHDPGGIDARLKIEEMNGGKGSALYETLHEPAVKGTPTSPACTSSLTEAARTGDLPPGATDVDAPGQSLYADVTSGIAVSRFRFADVQAQVVSATPTPESDWSGYSSSSGYAGPVTGEQLGYIRVWMAGGSVPSGTGVEWHDFVMDQSGETRPLHKADPAPMDCGEGLALFFAANEFDFFFSGLESPAFKAPILGAPFSGSGHGIWRAIAAGAGIALDTDGDGTADLLTGPYGRDFFCDASEDALATTANEAVMVLGQVVHSRSATGMYLDPDPVALPDGSARVFFGQPNGAFQFVSAPPGVPCRNDAAVPVAVLAAAAPLTLGRGPGDEAGPDVLARLRLAAMLRAVEPGRRP